MNNDTVENTIGFILGFLLMMSLVSGWYVAAAVIGVLMAGLVYNRFAQDNRDRLDQKYGEQ